MKSRFAITKAAFNKKEDSFHQQVVLKCMEETSEVLHLEYSFVWCWNLDISESTLEKPGKFWNLELEKDGEDQLHWLCEKWTIITYSQGQEYLKQNLDKEG